MKAISILENSIGPGLDFAKLLRKSFELDLLSRYILTHLA